MSPADGDDVPNLIHGELRGVEAEAVAAVDLHVAKCGRHPLGLQVRPHSADWVDRADQTALADDVEMLASTVVASPESHD